MRTLDQTFTQLRVLFDGERTMVAEREQTPVGWRETCTIDGQVAGWIDVWESEGEGFGVQVSAPVEDKDPVQVTGLTRLRRELVQRVRGDRLQPDEERTVRRALHALDKDLDATSVLLAGARRTWAPGERVLTLADQGDEVYIVLADMAVVRVPGRRTALVADGDVFGEMAVVGDGLRKATVDAAGDLVAFGVPYQALSLKAKEGLWQVAACRQFNTWLASFPAWEYLTEEHRRVWLLQASQRTLEADIPIEAPGAFVFLFDGEVELDGLRFSAPMLIPSGPVLPRTDARVAFLPAPPEPTII
jgi:hypothetical protein